MSAYAWELLSFAGLERVTKSSPAVSDQKCGNAVPCRSHRLGHARVRNAVRLAPLQVRMVIRVGSRRAADLKQDFRRGSQFVTHQYQVLMFEPLMENR